MTLLAQRHLMLRHVIGLAPLIALVAPVDRAKAACDPITSSANPLIKTIVTCTGPTPVRTAPPVTASLRTEAIPSTSRPARR